MVTQSVIVKSVERNALSMYEARKFLLGLENSGVSALPGGGGGCGAGSPPAVICPVGLDILASAGLGLSGLGEKDDRDPAAQLLSQATGCRLQPRVSFSV